MKNTQGTVTRANGVEVNTAKKQTVAIKVNSATAIEASQALKVSDTKTLEKKQDVASNESMFLAWFILHLQKKMESMQTTHGMQLEKQKYELLFEALKSQGYSLSAWGAKSNMARLDFPSHVEGKTKLVSGVVVYGAIRHASNFKIYDAKQTRYLHYINNCFHVFHVSTLLTHEQENVELKKLQAIDNVSKEKEKVELEKKEKV